MRPPSVVLGAAIAVSCGMLVGLAAAAEPASSVQPRTGVPASALAVIKTIPVGANPYGVAVNDTDDTVYVANTYSASVSVIAGRTGQHTNNIGVGSSPWGVAVDEADDTVYVTNGPDGSVSVIRGRTGTVGATIPVGSDPRGVAVNQGDDTVYVTNYGFPFALWVISGRDDTTVGAPMPVGGMPMGVAVDDADDTVYVADNSTGDLSVINGRTRTLDDTVPVDASPYGVAVHEADDTVYITHYVPNGTVSVVNGRTQVVAGTIAVGSYPFGVAVHQVDGTVYVSNMYSNTVSVINGRTRTVDDTVAVGDGPAGVAIDGAGANAGLVYVTNVNSNSVSVIGLASPTLGSSTGFAGDPVTISVSVPNLAPGFAMDDSTITAVSFGGAAVTGLTAGAGDTWTMTVPRGSGTVPVLVTLNGGLQASAGTFTYPPPLPPSAPRDATATAGDASASIAWLAPESPGSFPVTNYEVTSSPGGKTCLTSTLTCTVTGLANGTTYTFTVKALSGAGWGTTSTPSNAVTPTAPPTPSILITGSRDGQRITVTGTSMHLTSQTLRPWFRLAGQTTYTEGYATIPIAPDGTFTWSRKTNKRTHVYITHDTTKSNTVVIPAR